MFSASAGSGHADGRARAIEIGQRDVIQAPKAEGIVRYELSDDEWTTIRPMLPDKARGVPRVDDRRVLNGTFWVVRSGAPWRDLPSTFGPYTTCYNRFVRWRRAGVWNRIMDALCFSPYLYRARNLVERFFNKIKQCRRVATRYDKLAVNYLAFIQLASIRLWLRVNESTP
jgi:transposase